MEFYEKLIYLCKQKGVSRSKMADDIGISRSAPKNWAEKGTVPRFATIKKIADYFEVPISYFDKEAESSALLGETQRTTSARLRFHTPSPFSPSIDTLLPLLQTIEDGEPKFLSEIDNSYLLSNTVIDADFCFRVRDNSMIGARMMEGDLVFVKKSSYLGNGEIGVVMLGDEILLKRVYFDVDKNKLILQSENSKYEPLVFLDTEMLKVQILGKVVAFQSNVK